MGLSNVYHIVAKVCNIQQEISQDIDDLHACNVINQLYHGSAQVPVIMCTDHGITKTQIARHFK